MTEQNKNLDYRLGIWRGLKIGIIGFAIAGQFVTVAYYPFLWVAVALQSSLKKSYEVE